MALRPEAADERAVAVALAALAIGRAESVVVEMDGEDVNFRCVGLPAEMLAKAKEVLGEEAQK